MLKFIRAAAAVLAVAAVTGCAGMITGGPLIRPGEPTGAVRVSNGSRYMVDVVLISACNVSTYGLNRLASGAGIPPGRSYVLRFPRGVGMSRPVRSAAGGKKRGTACKFAPAAV